MLVVEKKQLRLFMKKGSFFFFVGEKLVCDKTLNPPIDGDQRDRPLKSLHHAVVVMETEEEEEEGATRRRRGRGLWAEADFR